MFRNEPKSKVQFSNNFLHIYEQLWVVSVVMRSRGLKGKRVGYFAYFVFHRILFKNSSKKPKFPVIENHGIVVKALGLWLGGMVMKK